MRIGKRLNRFFNPHSEIRIPQLNGGDEMLPLLLPYLWDGF
jgi:hypothetical protein